MEDFKKLKPPYYNCHSYCHQKKRLRINGTFRWTEQQTRDLLTIVFDNVKANPEQFEKPTAQKFYDRITESAPNLRNIKWDTMRTKMRHLKTSFLTALKWKGQTGAGLLESGDVKSVKEYIKRICPFYDDLHAIFARRVNIQPPAIYQSTEPILSLANNEEEALLEIDCETSSTTLLELHCISGDDLYVSTHMSQSAPANPYGMD